MLDTVTFLLIDLTDFLISLVFNLNILFLYSLNVLLVFTYIRGLAAVLIRYINAAKVPTLSGMLSVRILIRIRIIEGVMENR